MRSLLATLALAGFCSLLLSAADYYRRVPLDSPPMNDLRILAKEGFMRGWQEPEYSLLRLELAMLLQERLPDFYDAQEDGTTTSDSDAAARRLVKEFREELEGLGSSLPGLRQPAQSPAAANSVGVPVEKVEVFRVETAPQLLIIEDEQLDDHAPSSQQPTGSAAVILLDSSAGPAWEDAAVQAPGAEPPLPPDSLPPASASPATPAVVAEAGPLPQETASPPASSASVNPPPQQAALEPMQQRQLQLLSERDQAQTAAVAERAERHSPGPQPEESERLPLPSARRGPYNETIDFEVQPFADIQGQVELRSEGGASGDSKLRLLPYWADAGVDFLHEDWQARIAVNLNDRKREPRLSELWAEFRDSENGLYGRAGRVILPVGSRKGWFPTFSSVHRLGYTSANSIGIGWNKPGWGLSAWVYDPPQGAAGGSTALSAMAVNLELMSTEQADDSCWRLALGYASELGASESGLGNLQDSGIPALALSAGYSWEGQQWQLNLDYLGALESYTEPGLSGGAGDVTPRALALELIHDPHGLDFWGLRFEHSAGLLGSASARWSALYGRWLSEEMLARLELARSSYSARTSSRDDEWELVGDLNFVF